MVGSITFRSDSLIPWNGFKVICRLCSITVGEAPTMKIVPTGCPSYPWAPTSRATWMICSITWALWVSGRSRAFTCTRSSSSSAPMRMRTRVSRLRSWPASASTVSPSFTSPSLWHATMATRTFSTRE